MQLITIQDLKNLTKRKEFIDYINRTLKRAALNWEKTTDSKIPENIRNEHERKYEELTERVEKELALIGIECQWPGLFPIFIIRNQQEHNLEWAIKMALGEK